MTIEIHRPELEALIMERMKSGGFQNVEDVLLQVLKPSPMPSGKSAEPAPATQAGPGEPASGMVEENGLLVYRTGNPLPVQVVDDAVRRSREERSLNLLGNRP